MEEAFLECGDGAAFHWGPRLCWRMKGGYEMQGKGRRKAGPLLFKAMHMHWGWSVVGHCFIQYPTSCYMDRLSRSLPVTTEV